MPRTDDPLTEYDRELLHFLAECGKEYTPVQLAEELASGGAQVKYRHCRFCQGETDLLFADALCISCTRGALSSKGK